MYMKNKIIFGVHSSKENDLNSVRVYLAWKEEWESTKDAYNSQIFLDPELEWDLNDKLQKKYHWRK